MKGMRVLRLGWLAGAVLATALASPAFAGTYSVSACQAGGNPAPMGAWTPPTDGAIVNDCANGGPFGFDFQHLTQYDGVAAQWTFLAPAGTRISTLRVGDFWGSGGSDYAFSVVGDAVLVPPMSPAFATGFRGPLGLTGLSTLFVTFELRCIAACSSPGSLLASWVQVDLDDTSPPVAEYVPQDGSLRFTDEGGGVETAALEVDGVRRDIAVGGTQCQRPFVAAVPCATSGDVRLPPGRHNVLATFTDAGGNQTVIGPYTVGSAEPSPQVAPGPGAVPARPRGTVSLSGRRTIHARYSKPPLVRGTVRALDGAAIGGARLSVSGLPTGVTTDVKGRFSVRLPRGVSREVRFSYGDSVQSVKVIVAAPVRLATDRKSTRNGRAIKFTGSVPGAGKARTRVELQAWANGKWIPFKTADLRNGRFGASYRFTRTFATSRYRFRAVIHDDPDFPYATGRSAVVNVLVRP
jgi:hypothetical protein